MRTLIALLLLASVHASAQDLEPRAYGNAPVGLNFLILGYGYAQGGVVVDPSIPLTNADIRVHSGVVAYARSLSLWCRSGKFDVVVPFASLSGTADVNGEPRERDVTGFGDVRL